MAMQNVSKYKGCIRTHQVYYTRWQEEWLAIRKRRKW